MVMPFDTQMRAAPTLSVSAASAFVQMDVSFVGVACTAISSTASLPDKLHITAQVASGLTAGDGTNLQAGNTNARLWLSAHL